MLCDLSELKSSFDIDPLDDSENSKLAFLAELASGWIEEVVCRPLSKKVRTEYYGGSGTANLLLRCRPVFASTPIQVWEDERGYYGTPENTFNDDRKLEWGNDFFLKTDQDDGTSRCGILVRRGYWPRPSARQRGFLSPFMGDSYGNIKISYLSGYSADALPANIRLAAVLLVGRLRGVLPFGAELSADNFEERSLSVVISEKTKLLALVAPLVLPFRNWSW